MDKASKIYVAGHGGLVGSALVRSLKTHGYGNLIQRTSKELDLRRQADVEAFFKEERPDHVFLAAARVGGIWANNTRPAEFIYDNTAIETNIIHAAYVNGVKKLLFLGSSCIYPKNCPQPMKESYLLTGPLEPTNEAYAVAKIAGITMCRSYNRQYGTNFVSVMPTNLYGPDDNFDLEGSHVLPALMRKCHLARLAERQEWQGILEDERRFGRIPDTVRASLGISPEPHVSRAAGRPRVTVWGTGTPYREFLHVDDLADACVFVMRHVDATSTGADLINIGYGSDITIRDLATLIKDIVGFQGELVFDETKPDGTPQKLLDVSTLTELGWKVRIGLPEGIRQTYDWYCKFT